ncbi:MAG: TIGR04282 family arsenosugar biosynthesis glycosyltransferase [Saprospiraceae bacterium]|nr:TIGR04282 family arsenosugar biosynthesis glycosyltransferase [Saprospiraceae bacterium]
MNNLILFIRNPELGKVKTRLAASIGNEKALEIYRFLLDHTRRTALEVQAKRMLFYSENITQNDEWDEAFFEKHQQHHGDLGARMHHAFQKAFETGAKKVVIAGSDCPELEAGILQQAFDLLDTHDTVLGPSIDGGYYLLGLKTPSPELFENMVWSIETVFSQTLTRLKNTGKSCALLPVLNDIDTEEDWKRFSRLVGWSGK